MFEKQSAKKYRQQLHISGINMLNECGVRFEFRYIRGMKRPPNVFLLVGKSLDESVTRDLDNKIEHGELLKKSDVMEIAYAKFEEEQKKEPVELDAEEKEQGKALSDVLDEALDRTVKMASCHHEYAAPVIQPAATRRKFSINMDAFLRSRAKELHAAADDAEARGDKWAARVMHSQAQAMNAVARDGLDFVGEMDIVEKYEHEVGGNVFNKAPHDIVERLVIRDTKSSKKSPNEAIVHDSEQLTAYAVAAQVLDGKLPDAVALDYVVCTEKKKETSYKPLVSIRTPDDISVFLNRFANTVHAMHSGIFVPAKPDDWRCSPKWCGYYEVCPYAKKPKSVRVSG